MENSSQSHRSLRVVFLFLGFFALCSVGYSEQFYEGNTVFNACHSLPVLDKPHATARVVGQLAFGDSVRVLRLEGLYEVPDSDPDSKKRQIKRNSGAGKEDEAAIELNERKYTRVSWAALEGNRFASAACLVKEDRFLKQDPAQAEAKVLGVFSVAKRGFSEEEEGDMTVMKGAAGKAKMGRADYMAMDGFLKSLSSLNTRSGLEGFQQQGKLGLYKN